MARKVKAPRIDADWVKLTLLLSPEDAKLVDGEVSRASVEDAYGRSITRSDVVRRCIRATLAKK